MPIVSVTTTAADVFFGTPSAERVATAGELLLRAVTTLVPGLADAVGGWTPPPREPRAKTPRSPHRQDRRQGKRGKSTA